VKKLLLIEEDTDARDMAVFTFENNGYEVIQAGKDISVQEIADLKPHIIVIGYQLGGTNGNDICAKLKASELTGQIPIILYSANLSVEQIGAHTCADAVVAKPYELEDFVYWVHRLALS
jgi:DNA-binding response OmpR family regulator